MMGACLSGDGASEASEDNTLDGKSSIGELESDWYLDVARQVASTTHTRSTVKAREGLEKLTCALLEDGQDQEPRFTFQSLEVVTTCGQTHGFDLDADPYEGGHTHELDLFPARSTFYLCDWPRGKRNDAARHFLRLY